MLEDAETRLRIAAPDVMASGSTKALADRGATDVGVALAHELLALRGGRRAAGTYPNFRCETAAQEIPLRGAARGVREADALGDGRVPAASARTCMAAIAECIPGVGRRGLAEGRIARSSGSGAR